MVDGAEGQAVGPAPAEVSDVNVLKEEKDKGEEYSPNIYYIYGTLKTSVTL